MKRTMAKIEQAQASIRAAKPRSAIAPLGRELRKARIGEGTGGVWTGVPGAGTGEAAGGFAGGTVDLESESIVMELVDTIALFQMQPEELVVPCGNTRVACVGGHPQYGRIRPLGTEATGPERSRGGQHPAPALEAERS